MEDWKILRNRSRCDKPGCPLAGEREYFAILRLPDCVRLERCASCFEELRHGAESMPFHWKVRRNLDGTKNPMLDLESLRALFDRLGEASDSVDAPPDLGDIGGTEPIEAVVAADADADADAADADGVDPATARHTAAGLRYLVALLLLRKRRLKMVDPKTSEQAAADLLVVDPRIAEMEPVALYAPELDPDRLGNLREELMAAIGEDTESETATAET